MRAVLGAAALAVLLAGCGTNIPQVSPTSHGVTVAPATGTATPTATGSAEPLPAPSPGPSGAVFVTSASHGVKFALPSGWTTFDLTTFTKPEVRAALEPLAKQLGETVDQYIQELSTYNDLIVNGPQRNGTTGSVSIRREAAQASGYVPTAAEAQAQLKEFPVTGVTTAVTPLGRAYVIAYTRPGEATGSMVHCSLLGLPSGQGTMFMAAVESGDAAELTSLVNDIVATLQRA